MGSFNVPFPYDLKKVINGNNEVILNNDQPAAPAGNQNVTWQVDEFGNISANVTEGGGGGIGGSGTAGYVPVFSDATTLEDSPIDVGLTFPNTVFIDGTGVDGAPSCISLGGSSGNIFIDSKGGGVKTGSTDGAILITSGKGMSIRNSPSTNSGSNLQIINDDTGGTYIQDNGGGGVKIFTNGVGISYDSILIPLLLYSVAGTPLPAANSVPAGTQATVSDAISPTYMGAYTGGAGGVVCAVISDGATGWFTH